MSYVCHIHPNSNDFSRTTKRRKPLKLNVFKGFSNVKYSVFLISLRTVTLDKSRKFGSFVSYKSHIEKASTELRMFYVDVMYPSKPAALTFLSIAFLLFLELYPIPVDNGGNYESALKNAATFVGCFVGIQIVYIADEGKFHFQTEAVWWAQLLKILGGLALVLVVKEGTKPLLEAFLPFMPARIVRYCLVVVVAGIVWPLTFKWFSKLGVKK